MIEKFFEEQKDRFIGQLPEGATESMKRAMTIAFYSGGVTAVGIMTELTTRMPDTMAIIEIAKLVQHLNDFKPSRDTKPPQ